MNIQSGIQCTNVTVLVMDALDNFLSCFTCFLFCHLMSKKMVVSNIHSAAQAIFFKERAK